MIWLVRKAVKVAVLSAVALGLYFGVTVAQVWLTAREYDPHVAQAIIVMGAGAPSGVPDTILAARLDEAVKLYKEGYSKLIGVTGSTDAGAPISEAQASKVYLVAHGIPSTAIIKAGGADSWGNIAELAPALRTRHVHSVMIATDPFHEDESMAIASSLGFVPYPTPTQSSPIRGMSTVQPFLKEGIAVGAGRVIGFENLHWIP